MPPSGPAPRIDAGLLLLRLGVGTLLLFHGVYKITHGVGWMAGPLGGVGLPPWVAYGVYVGEVLAPVLLILGLWTRLAGLVIAFNMFMAIFLARRGDIAKISEMGGGWAIELELLFLLGGLTLALTGGGRYGLGGGAGRRR
jgi:putative oxidoreductase